MSDTIIVAGLALLGTLCGSWAGVTQANKLVNYRLDRLDEQVKSLNKLLERLVIVERDLETAWKRLDMIKGKWGD